MKQLKVHFSEFFGRKYAKLHEYKDKNNTQLLKAINREIDNLRYDSHKGIQISKNKIPK